MAWPPLVDGADLPGGPYDDAAVAAAAAAVRTYCNWHIAPTITEELTLDGSGGVIQPLPTLHLTAVAAVVEEGNDVPIVAGLWTEAGYLWRSSRWTRQLRGLVATITHGFDECPLEVAAVVASLAKRGPVGTSIERESAGGVSIGYGAGRAAGPIGLGAYEEAVLDHYRIERRP